MKKSASRAAPKKIGQRQNGSVRTGFKFGRGTWTALILLVIGAGLAAVLFLKTRALWRRGWGEEAV